MFHTNNKFKKGVRNAYTDELLMINTAQTISNKTKTISNKTKEKNGQK